MDQSAVAAQLYTLREYTKIPSTLRETLRRVKKIGYQAVQVSAIGPIDPADLASMLAEIGLTCCVTHTPFERMKSDPVAVLEDHRRWGCGLTAVGGHFPPELSTPDWDRFIDEFNETSLRLAAGGLRLGYHNHNHELAKYRPGQTILDRLMQRCDPSVWFEIDTYWIAAGGGDPAAWIRKAAGRIPAVHLKDMTIHYPREQRMAEVGEGNLNWPEILDACREAGVQWFIVEQDTCHRDPFESLAISFENLMKMSR
jgi:sugar phosphate isomerase/epimerase